MNSFDLSILTYLNSFANLYPHLDVLITQFQNNTLLKGGLLIAVWWYLWFQGSPNKELSIVREKLIAGLMAMIVGLVVARTLAHILPFRIRPVSNPNLHFVIPNFSGGSPPLEGWSAFPSDHAVVWFSIAATIYLVNKPMGWLCTVYACLLGVGRVYAGAHHPTDILAGAAIAIAIVYAFNSIFALRHIGQLLKWSDTRRGLFYACLFLSTYQISNMFNEVRAIGELSWNAAKLVHNTPSGELHAQRE